MIRYSEHAGKRLAERSIQVRDVEIAIRNILDLVQVRYGRFAVCGLLPSGKFVVVVYEKEEEDFIVITAVKTNREGARRYGFSGI
ncbi:MAG TPA: DUF4258 domain-containing protein [Nitrososphaerales archaeon]|nr:DUF4258 domain-containing protein [Nitrososphaerales archaeon]